MKLISIADTLPTLVDPAKNWRARLIAQWTTIMGPLSNHAKIVKIVDRTVIIWVDSACWRHELHILKEHLVYRINAGLKEPCVDSLRFVGTYQKYTPRYPRKTITPNPPKKNRILTAAERAALDEITDPELRTILIECAQNSHE